MAQFPCKESVNWCVKNQQRRTSWKVVSIAVLIASRTAIVSLEVASVAAYCPVSDQAVASR